MIEATYYIESQLDLSYVAEQIAKEQSAGHSTSWEGISDESYLAGKSEVAGLEEVEPTEDPLPLALTRPSGARVGVRKAARVRVRYSNWRCEDGLVSLLNTLLGEPQHLGIVSALRLEQVDLQSLRGDSFPGPPFGNSWFAKGAPPATRTLLCAPIKPSAGLLPEEAGKLAYQAAVGGATVVKDDELAFSTARTSNVSRARVVAREVRRAEQDTGERKVYLANAIAPGYRFNERCRDLVEAGADALLVAPSLQGQDCITTMRHDGIDLPVVAHNAYQTNASRLVSFGLALPLWVSLQRLAGADGVVLPSGYGSFGFSAEETRSMVESCHQDLDGKKPSLAMHSGSVSVQNADKLMALHDTALVALTSGTGIFDHPGGAEAGAQALRAVIDPEWRRDHGRPEILEESIRLARETGQEWAYFSDRMNVQDGHRG
ncbi:RuBisCO large subunit C-terminal-like domain-containing protein [Streptomyces sp. NBC_00370]|uniref:RuBisCO large subunit C-terminal-like domain-containing protein n=1 Tax=Streptomyces sp. NBC_00370 TaxID=2975728 RepID=UPI002E2623DC